MAMSASPAKRPLTHRIGPPLPLEKAVVFISTLSLEERGLDFGHLRISIGVADGGSERERGFLGLRVGRRGGHEGGEIIEAEATAQTSARS